MLLLKQPVRNKPATIAETIAGLGELANGGLAILDQRTQLSCHL